MGQAGRRFLGHQYPEICGPAAGPPKPICPWGRPGRQRFALYLKSDRNMGGGQMALRGTFGPRMIVWQHAADHHRAENLQHHTIPAGDAAWRPHAGVMTKSAGQRDKVSGSSPIASVVDKAGNIHVPTSPLIGLHGWTSCLGRRPG